MAENEDKRKVRQATLQGNNGNVTCRLCFCDCSLRQGSETTFIDSPRVADSKYFKVLAAFAIFSFFASVVPNLGWQQPPGEGSDGQENLSVSRKRFVIPRMTMASVFRCQSRTYSVSLLVAGESTLSFDYSPTGRRSETFLGFTPFLARTKIVKTATLLPKPVDRLAQTFFC